VEPSNSTKLVLFIAVFSTLISTPFSLLFHWIIKTYVVAPASEEEEDTAEVGASSDNIADALSPILPVSMASQQPSSSGNGVDQRRSKSIFNVAKSLVVNHSKRIDYNGNANVLLKHLLINLQQYRLELTQADRKEFDGILFFSFRIIYSCYCYTILMLLHVFFSDSLL
jgi:hypothetical protein